MPNAPHAQDFTAADDWSRGVELDQLMLDAMPSRRFVFRPLLPGEHRGCRAPDDDGELRQVDGAMIDRENPAQHFLFVSSPMSFARGLPQSDEDCLTRLRALGLLT